MRGLSILRMRSVTLQRVAAVVLVCYIAAGCVVSLSSGLTFDDRMEQFTFGKIVTAAKNLLGGRSEEYRELQSYGDRYYGIGFDFFAYPFQLALRSHLTTVLPAHDVDDAMALGARPAILLLFGISVVAFYKLTRWFIDEPPIAIAATACYAACPYLFGHAMMNVRDSPFMSIYLLCTYFSLRTVKRHLAGRTCGPLEMVTLGATTAALASIRIPGLMILVQYAVTFLISNRFGGVNRILTWRNIASFFAVLLPLVVLLFPAVWLDPVGQVFAGLKFVGWYHQPGCTLTWGQCMPAYATPSYVGGWFAAKLPVLIVAGLAFIPAALRKLWSDVFRRTAYLTLLFGSVYVLVVIIPLRAHLYDETRQLMFIYPLLFLSSLVAVYLANHRIAFTAMLLSVAIFVWDQFRLNPYQYVYFNEIVRFFNVDRLFETDYWGLSAREHVRLLEADARSVGGSECVYADPLLLYRPFVSKFCVAGLDALPQSLVANQVVVAIACYANRVSPRPNCEISSAVTRSLPLSNRVLTLSVAYRCRPQ